MFSFYLFISKALWQMIKTYEKKPSAFTILTEQFKNGRWANKAFFHDLGLEHFVSILKNTSISSVSCLVDNGCLSGAEIN